MAHKSCSKKFLSDATFDSDDVELSGVDFNKKDFNQMEYNKRKKGRKKSFGRMSPEWYFGGRIENRIFAKLVDDVDFRPDHWRGIKYRNKARHVIRKK